MKLPPHYRSKIKGGWIGKNVGGTLGGPEEGNTALQYYSYYDPVPTEPMPNDDFELQMVWLEQLDRRGLFTTPADFGHSWQTNLKAYISEYLQSVLNLRRGFIPPLSGAYNNWHSSGMGATIRSEIWAMIAPGMPDIAAAYAYMDSSLDHTREGVDGAMFMAAVESAAFVESDPQRLVQIGLSYIRQEGQVAGVVRRVIEEHRKGTAPQRLRHLLCADFSHPTDFTYTPINVGFIVLGLIYGESFDDALCLAVNCGYDTDCTGASLASILGIMLGAENIPARWLAPIGESVVISPAIQVENCPKMLDDLTERIAAYGERLAQDPEAIRRHLADYTHLEFLGVKSPKPVVMPSAMRMRLLATPAAFLDVDYVDSPEVGFDVAKKFDLLVINRTAQPLSGTLKLTAPAGWAVGLATPDSETLVLPVAVPAQGRQVFSLAALAGSAKGDIAASNPLPLELTLGAETLPTQLFFAGKKTWLVSVPIDQDDAETLARVEAKGSIIAANVEARAFQHGDDDLTRFVPKQGKVVYLQLNVLTQAKAQERMMANSIGPIQVWINAAMVVSKTYRCAGIIPAFHLQTINPGAIDGMGFADVTFPAGESTILIRLEGTSYPQEVNFSMVGVKPTHQGLPGVIADFTPFTVVDAFARGRADYLSLKNASRSSLVTT